MAIGRHGEIYVWMIHGRCFADAHKPLRPNAYAGHAYIILIQWYRVYCHVQSVYSSLLHMSTVVCVNKRAPVVVAKVCHCVFVQRNNAFAVCCLHLCISSAQKVVCNFV